MLEELIFKHLQSFRNDLEPYLASYGDYLAIFAGKAPDDMDETWNDGKSQYGRIVFYLDTNTDPEREVSGKLAVDVFCEDGAQNVGEIESVVRPIINGYFFSCGDMTIAAQWHDSRKFVEPTNKVCGTTISYDLYAFPSQTTCDPDPIALLNLYTKEAIPNARVIGLEDTGEIFKPTNDIPVIYWRAMSVSKCAWIPDTFSCSWQTMVCRAHIIAEDNNVMASMARRLDNALTLQKSLLFDNGTTLRVDRNNQVNSGADPMKQGQLTVEATYGILNIIKSGKIENIYYTDTDRRG